jgi:hypothetical protein
LSYCYYYMYNVYDMFVYSLNALSGCTCKTIPTGTRYLMGTGTGTKLYPRAGMTNPRGYGCGRVFVIPDPNLTRCHP